MIENEFIDDENANNLNILSGDFSDNLDEEIDLAGGAFIEPAEFEGSIGRTMYDSQTARDNTVTVLLPREHMGSAPSQSLIRIKSRPKEMGGDGRVYVGVVVQGPFADPDGLRADAPIIVTSTVRGTQFTPRFHGRVQVEILGEEIDGNLIPPRFRPLPNSPVFSLSNEETKEALRLGGDVRLGLAVGFETMPVSFATTRKDVIPRHTAILGTTGGGKSTTVSGLAGKLSESGVSTVVIDTEGEYTQLMEPTEDPKMLTELARRGLEEHGAKNVTIYHLVGRETSNPSHNNLRPFSLKFSNLSPYAVQEILGLNEAQGDRFQKAYSLTRSALMKFKVFPVTDADHQQLLDLDELEEGFPKMTLQHLYDVVRMCADKVAKETQPTPIGSHEFNANRDELDSIVSAANLASNQWSWRKVQGSLARLLRLKIFDNPTAAAPDYVEICNGGGITLIDLSDTDSPQVNNLVISEVLRGLMLTQDRNYQCRKPGDNPKRVAIVIEEAHEFLSAERIKQMPVLFQQVARIARRGRKRWLGLVFVTQLPQHLPNEVFGLVNNFVLHKISDTNVVDRLKRTVGVIDDGLWARLPNLAPGQAIVSLTSLTRPLLVSIDPTPHKLRMID